MTIQVIAAIQSGDLPPLAGYALENLPNEGGRGPRRVVDARRRVAFLDQVFRCDGALANIPRHPRVRRVQLGDTSLNEIESSSAKLVYLTLLNDSATIKTLWTYR